MNPFWQPDVLISLRRQREASADVEVPSAGALDEHAGHYLGRATGNRQFMVVSVAVLLTLGTLGVRAFSLQVVHGQTYRRLAEGNRVRGRPVLAPRGLLEDRYGVPLSKNAPRLSLALVPREVPRDESLRTALFQDVSSVAGVPYDNLVTAWDALSPEQRSSIGPTIVASDIPFERSPTIRLRVSHWPGFELLTTALRTYPELTPRYTSLSHILGYVGRVTVNDLAQSPNSQPYTSWNSIGKNGLELTYESLLRGVDGHRDVEVNALGQEQHLVAEEMSVPGQTLQLTIDAELQHVVETALQDGLRRAGVHRGVAIVLDPHDSSVLAAVSLPSFDANEFSRGQSVAAYQALQADPDHPLFNRAIQGLYPSGSTIKPIIAAAALAERIITPDTRFLSTGGLSVGQSFFPDWKEGGHGWTNVRQALAESVNTFFYIIGGGYGITPGLGIDRLRSYAERFGLGRDTGIDLPGEAAGLVPSPEWKQAVKGERWYIGDTYHVAIGQGDILVTPLQVANYTAVLANGGTLYVPHLRSATVGADGTVRDRYQPTVVSQQLIDPAVLAVVREGMRQTVITGSARLLQDLPVSVAGKTGTAEPGGGLKPHAWFTGFAPFDDPEVVVTVLLENAGEGSTYAVPVVRDIIAWWVLHRQQH